jgi:uncharacterized protein
LIREVERALNGWATNGLIRIPPEIDVPLTERVGRLIDTSVFRRLSEISQLGLVHQVYPGAKHSRFEHSLGVYRNALLLLQTLSHQSRFSQIIDARGEEAFVVASLLHDAGHWPFCHPIEDMRLASMPSHESRLADILAGHEIADCIRSDWSCTGDDVMSIVSGKHVGNSRLSPDAVALLSSCLSGPVDVDKLDYLVRDSLHAGIPYGRNFDASRLLASFTVHPDKPKLAITEKGRAAAEMMVFARYVMFSEVYWHHAVRSATAMLQRMVFDLKSLVKVSATVDLDESSWIASMRDIAYDTDTQNLSEGLFGRTRQLYKRVAEFNVLDRGDLHRELAHRPYWWLVACGDELARRCSIELGRHVHGNEILIDAPPVKLEVDINMDVVMRSGSVRKLADVSPVADSLAHQQFDGHVKRVRIFVRPALREAVGVILQDGQLILDAIETINREVI